MPININMAKARAIHLAEIRRVRDLELGARDITFMRAVEVGDTNAQAMIGMEKQVLRDIPETFDLKIARTSAQLKELWPAELQRPTKPVQ